MHDHIRDDLAAERAADPQASLTRQARRQPAAAKAAVQHLWDYREQGVKSGLFKAEFFDDAHRHAPDSPVFKQEYADNNVLLCPDIDDQHKQKILGEIPAERSNPGREGGARQRWFRSMKSSQSLALSVFGNLKHYGKLDLLKELVGTDGQPLFICQSGPADCVLEYESSLLNEPRNTHIDVFFPGAYQVAVECKYCEGEVGACSRPKLKQDEPEYCVKGACDMHPMNLKLAQRLAGMEKEAEARGAQLTYPSDCALSKHSIKYWEFIPQLFTWATEMTDAPCPLRMPYQLVRTVLLACVRDGKADPKHGHAVLLYDRRNSAFLGTGRGWQALDQVRCGLKNPSLLQECTWQAVAGAIRKDPEMRWLVDGLRDKYGIE